jgi:hypothetical protein
MFDFFNLKSWKVRISDLEIEVSALKKMLKDLELNLEMAKKKKLIDKDTDGNKTKLDAYNGVLDY